MTDSAVSHSYPRPQLVRDNWRSLDGTWQFGIGTSSKAIDRTIRVPFSPETPASGLQLRGYLGECWYRKTFSVLSAEGQRTLLHFEAADYLTRVWVNGTFVGAHEGGYTRFSFDITNHLNKDTEQTLIVACADDPHDLAKPRGKQDWLPDSHSIWYPRTTGIWQSVWIETAPPTHLRSLRWTPDVATWSLALDARFSQVPDGGHRLRVELAVKGRLLVDDTFSVNADELSRTITLPDGGIDSVRDELLWSPDHPTLIDATLTLLDSSGKAIDRVRSYAAMRSVGTLGDRFMLNSRPVELRLLLDQGYWPDTGQTPPDDEAIIHDIELVKAMGFNGVRKHQKIESERFLYFADRLGIFVWEEMPSAYRFRPDAIRRTVSQWTDAIERDVSHPCIIAWVPVNESWGVPDLPMRADQRAFVESLYHLTKALDPTRPVVSNDGWEMSTTDLVNIHDYDHDPDQLAQRYDASARSIPQILASERPGKRVLLLEQSVYMGQPILLTEFGGIALSSDATTSWGYSRATSSADLARQYCRLLTAVRSVKIFGGFCYTQFTDTYQETNGLVSMDRTPKIDPSLIDIATRGSVNPQEAARVAAIIEGFEEPSLETPRRRKADIRTGKSVVPRSEPASTTP